MDGASRADRPPQRGQDEQRTGTGGWLVDAAAVALAASVASAYRLTDLAATPPGLHVDEAVNGLDILFTIPRQHPVFFELNNGREPLFIYLQALSVWLHGPNAFALRITSAIVGVLTVIVLYWLGRELLGRRVGLVAALGLSTSLWHVVLSRVGLRGISAPLLWVLTLALLWRGIRRRETVSLALAGLTLSLGLYTYLSARFAVVLVLLLLLYEACVAGRALARQWRGLALAGAIACVTVSPLAAYFATHPDSFIGRGEQVSILNPNPTIEGRPSDLRQNVRDNLGMFAFRGDDNPRHNVPGKPVFEPLALSWFVLGLTALAAIPTYGAARFLWARRKQDGQTSRSPLLSTPSRWTNSCAWIALWIPLAFAPGLISHESPNYLRLTVLAPAVYLVWALGVEIAARGVSAVVRGRVTTTSADWRRSAASIATVALIALPISAQAESTWRAYFGDWAHRADVYNAFDGGLTRLAEAVESGAALGTAPRWLGPEVISYIDRSPPLLFLSPITRESRWMQGYSSLLLLPRTDVRSGVYLVSGADPLRDIPRRYFPGVSPEIVDRDPAGSVVAASYRLDVARLAAIRQPTRAMGRQYGHGAVLEGVTIESATASPGQELGVSLLWRQVIDAEVVYAPYLHVVDEQGKGWGQDDLLGFAVGGFRTGDQFVSRHVWRVPADAPPLSYRLEVGMATRPFGWPPGPPTALGPPVDAGSVRVLPGIAAIPAPEPARPVALRISGGPELIGHDGIAATARPGDVLHVDLLWRAPTRPARNVVADVVLEAPTGRIAGSGSAEPAYGRYPTRDWPPGAAVRDPRDITVSGNAEPGVYTVLLRATDSVSGEKLGQVELGRVTIEAPERSFAVPPMQHRVAASFGGEVALLGYDLSASSVSPGGVLGLTLYWQSLGRPARNYTVFTHLLDFGDRVVGQQDSQPAKGQSPTSGWVQGQIVVDAYELRVQPDVQAKELELEVGLYDATTGARLAVDGTRTDRLILARLPVSGR